MRCGISTACFYPEETLAVLRRFARAKVPLAELFINTFGELEPDYVARMADIAGTAGLVFSSMHPFTGALEGLLFASRYATRFKDGLALYRRYFAACHTLGINKLVYHGDRAFKSASVPMEEYVRGFARLYQVGQEYGVTVCHENVAYCRLNSSARVRAFRREMGEEAALVLDVKQVRRKNSSLNAMLAAMAGAVRLVHISDAAVGEPCLVPGQGSVDFAGLIAQLKGTGFDGDLIIELYTENFHNLDELVDAMHMVQALV